MKTPYRILGLTLLISTGLLRPIFAVKVKTQMGENAGPLSRYKTFQWLPPRVLTKVGIVENNPANPVLKEVIGRQLSGKGLSELPDGADLMVQAWVTTEEVPQLEAMVFISGPDTLYGTPIATLGRWNRQGALYINLIDRLTKKSAWSAMASDTWPSATLNPDEIRSRLNRAATDIFKKYPLKK
jgi:hypothetical protein